LLDDGEVLVEPAGPSLETGDDAVGAFRLGLPGSEPQRQAGLLAEHDPDLGLDGVAELEGVRGDREPGQAPDGVEPGLGVAVAAGHLVDQVPGLLEQHLAGVSPRRLGGAVDLHPELVPGRVDSPADRRRIVGFEAALVLCFVAGASSRSS
jgi:hypothetical protein